MSPHGEFVVDMAGVDGAVDGVISVGSGRDEGVTATVWTVAVAVVVVAEVDGESGGYSKFTWSFIMLPALLSSSTGSCMLLELSLSLAFSLSLLALWSLSLLLFNKVSPRLQPLLMLLPLLSLLLSLALLTRLGSIALLLLSLLLSLLILLSTLETTLTLCGGSCVVLEVNIVSRCAVLPLGSMTNVVVGTVVAISDIVSIVVPVVGDIVIINSVDE